jgi:hypothetical protein
MTRRDKGDGGMPQESLRQTRKRFVLGENPLGMAIPSVLF